jgi:hypothetical protein
MTTTRQENDWGGPGLEADEQEPMVSVLTIFYNRADLVATSLGSVLNQTYRNLEVIAIDDGSTDETLAEMEKFAGDHRLRLIAKENSGFTNSMIMAAGLARGSLIAVHDAGDVSLPERVARQVEAMRAYPDVGVVGCKVVNPVIGTARTKIVGRPNGLPFRPSLMARNMFTHGEVMFRKNLYDKVAGYRRQFRFAQDIDLWIRISQHAGYHTVQDVLYERVEIAGSVSASAEKTLAQQQFSELARQCGESIDRGGPDPVEQFGDEAPAKLKPSARLADKLARIAIRFALRSNDVDGAARIARAAVASKRTPRALGAYAFATALRTLRRQGAA